MWKDEGLEKVLAIWISHVWYLRNEPVPGDVGI